MKQLPGQSIDALAHELLKGARIDSAALTSYTVDEGELWRVAHALGLHHKKALRIRYDSSGLRTWGDARIVPPGWLQTCQNSEAGRNSKRRVPPIYHPKLCLVEAGRRVAAIVSTGNIAESDQCHTANIQCGFVITPAIASKMRQWMLAARPERTLCLVVGTDKRPEIQITNESTWALFSKHRDAFGADGEEWQLASPFWSTAGIAMAAKGTRVHADAYFRDQAQAQAVASSQAGSWLTCHVPYGKKPFHQKVVAWRGRRGRKSVSVVYIGSANLSAAGFVGTPPGTARNWEAGVILVGGDEIWEIGRAAARGGIAKWRKVRIRAGGRVETTEVGPDGIDDLAGRLQLHLSRTIRVTGQAVKRLDTPGPIGASLLDVTIHEDRHGQKLKPGQVRRVPTNRNRVYVAGLYRCSNRSCFHVEVELPLLTQAPALEESGSALGRLKAMLVEHAYPGKKFETGAEGADRDRNGEAPRTEDIRLPYQDLLACLRRNPAFARAWLQHVESNTMPGPPFWRVAATHLLHHHIL